LINFTIVTSTCAASTTSASTVDAATAVLSTAAISQHKWGWCTAFDGQAGWLADWHGRLELGERADSMAN
jgi:hypothetical protein